MKSNNEPGSLFKNKILVLEKDCLGSNPDSSTLSLISYMTTDTLLNP